MIDINNIKLHQSFKNKEDIFNRVEQDLLALNAVKDGYGKSMKARDESSSVALGNFLFLPHGNSDSTELILKNTIMIYHLKDMMNIDGQDVKIVVALAIKPSDQMEAIETVGIAFSDEDEVEKVLFDKNVSAQSIYNFLNEI